MGFWVAFWPMPGHTAKIVTRARRRSCGCFRSSCAPRTKLQHSGRRLHDGVRMGHLSVLCGNTILHLNNILIYYITIYKCWQRQTCFHQFLAIQYLTPCLLCTIPVLFFGFLCFFPAKEEETVEKKKQEQAAAEQKQALSSTLLQRTCQHQWRWRSNMRHPLTQKFCNLARFFRHIFHHTNSKSKTGDIWVCLNGGNCTQICSLTIKFWYDAPFLGKPSTFFFWYLFFFLQPYQNPCP